MLLSGIDMMQLYNAVNEVLSTLDFDALYTGFRKYPFALYSSKEIVLGGEIIPYQESFRGNTSIMYAGEYTAIWNIEIDPVDDPELLAYCLVHEMFHCHQRVNRESRYPSDFALLQYPADMGNFIKKYHENKYLADALDQSDPDLLRKFVYIRESRYKSYPFMVRQEWKAETLEGMAEYVGLKALANINASKYHAVVETYLDKLRSESEMLFDIRQISYYTGTVYFLCLEKFGLSVCNDFDSEQTAYEQNRIHVKDVSAEIYPVDWICQKYTQRMQEKNVKIREFVDQSQYKKCQAFICGYDPMNMFRLGDRIYCSHFIALEENGEVKTITSEVVLQLAEGSAQNVIGYYTRF